MNEEKRIEIVSDNDGIIAFQDIVVKNDTVDRNEVADVEREIERLEQEKISIDKKLAELKEKIAYAKHIIAIADKKKAEQEVANELETKNVENEIGEQVADNDIEQENNAEVIESEPATIENVVEEA